MAFENCMGSCCSIIDAVITNCRFILFLIFLVPGKMSLLLTLVMSEDPPDDLLFDTFIVTRLNDNYLVPVSIRSMAVGENDNLIDLVENNKFIKIFLTIWKQSSAVTQLCASVPEFICALLPPTIACQCPIDIKTGTYENPDARVEFKDNWNDPNNLPGGANVY